jgi:hypothetical protein
VQAAALGQVGVPCTHRTFSEGLATIGFSEGGCLAEGIAGKLRNISDQLLNTNDAEL